MDGKKEKQKQVKEEKIENIVENKEKERRSDKETK